MHSSVLLSSACPDDVTLCYKGEFVPEFIRSILAVIRVFLRSRGDTALEVLALRQQLAVLKRKRPRPPLSSMDRLFWTILSRGAPAPPSTKSKNGSTVSTASCPKQRGSNTVRSCAGSPLPALKSAITRIGAPQNISRASRQAFAHFGMLPED
jgi:hypothetical protein